jgi:hypothetical protein
MLNVRHSRNFAKIRALGEYVRPLMVLRRLDSSRSFAGILRPSELSVSIATLRLDFRRRNRSELCRSDATSDKNTRFRRDGNADNNPYATPYVASQRCSVLCNYSQRGKMRVAASRLDFCISVFAFRDASKRRGRQPRSRSSFCKYARFSSSAQSNEATRWYAKCRLAYSVR